MNNSLVVSSHPSVPSSFGAAIGSAQWLQSGFRATFRAHSGFEMLSELHFERIVASNWLKWLLCVASEQPFRAHTGFEVASEQPFRAHCGFEVAPVREIAMFLRRHVATKLRDLRDLPGPKRNY